MAYRIKFAETPEQKAKEESFMGLGLTSRKNLCIHPDVSAYFIMNMREPVPQLTFLGVLPF